MSPLSGRTALSWVAITLGHQQTAVCDLQTKAELQPLCSRRQAMGGAHPLGQEVHQTHLSRIWRTTHAQQLLEDQEEKEPSCQTLSAGVNRRLKSLLVDDAPGWALLDEQRRKIIHQQVNLR
jgi:hypothetical protein